MKSVYSTIAALLLALALLANGLLGQDALTARRLGKAHYEEGQYRPAAEQFRKVVEAQPRGSSFEDHFNLGVALMGVPDDEAALAALETARQMRPNHPAPLYSLGILHKRQGRFREALDFLQRAEKAGAGDLATLFNTGAVLMAMGRSEEALRYFQRVTERGFDFGPSWYLASEYRIARLLQRLGRSEEAVQAQRRWEERRKAMKEPNESPATLELGPLATPMIPPDAATPRQQVPVPVFVKQATTPAKRAPAATRVIFDYDVDGDVDRLTLPANCGAPHLERNNGADKYTDTTEEARILLPEGQQACDAAVADIDADGDPDIVMAGPGAAWVFSNLRGGRFERQTPFGNVGTALARGPVAVETADLNADGAFDVIFGSAAGVSVWWNRARQLSPLNGARAPFAVTDVNGDGLLDVVTAGDKTLQFFLNSATQQFQRHAGPAAPAGITSISGTYAATGAYTLRVQAAGSATTFRRTQPKSRWLAFDFEGVRSNKEGVGAIIEVKAGDFYVRRMKRAGERLVVEVGPLAKIDVVRVTWPNGIIQNTINTQVDRELRLSEQDRLASSCPLLYLWDGERFRFFAEVLSSTPLGEPDGQGGFILPGRGENVFLTAGRMAPRDGRYVFQLTEELREVIYLDRARLVALDYPESLRAFVDEAYRGAPVSMPPALLRDVASLEFRRDPAGARQKPLPGLMEAHATYFDVPAGADFLVMRGWVYWMDSNVATAAAQNPEYTAVFPRLEERQPDGTWKTLIADLGLPSGAGRHVLADLRGRLTAGPASAAKKLRIVTNLRVFWEEILAGRHAGPANAVRRRSALPITADLHYRGFSEPRISPTRSEPDHYDYTRLLDEAPWNAIPGRYTRYGTVRSLLASADDRLVVFGAGDEITLEFAERAFPPLPAGWRRDFVLELSGWAKAGETNTASAHQVEPIPYRGMKRYPFTPGPEPAWQKQWLTRRPMPHHAPLAPLYLHPGAE